MNKNLLHCTFVVLRNTYDFTYLMGLCNIHYSTTLLRFAPTPYNVQVSHSWLLDIDKLPDGRSRPDTTERVISCTVIDRAGGAGILLLKIVCFVSRTLTCCRRSMYYALCYRSWLRSLYISTLLTNNNLQKIK